MKIVLQRVSEASVTVDGEVVGQIGKGFLVLLGVQATDTEEIADRMVDKMCRLRIFEDENGKTNLSLADVGGELLVVSQFTLYADCRKGNRPSFIKAGPPEMAGIDKLEEWALSVKKAALRVCGRAVPEVCEKGGAGTVRSPYEGESGQ